MQPIALAGVPYPVSNFGRVVITCVAALLVGAIAYANAFDLHDTALGTVLYSSALTWALFLLPLLAFPRPVKASDSAGPSGPTPSAANCAKSTGLGNGRRTGRLISRRRAAGFRLRRESGGRRGRAAS